MATVIGIDLGTTNTCVAVVENGRPVVIPSKSGQTTSPSIIAFTESGKRLIGQVAKRQMVTNAQHTVTAAKRLIGRKWASPEVQQAVLQSTYSIVEGPHGDARVEARGRVYSIPELSAFVLQEMKLIAEAYLGLPIDGAVITVPAYFNDSQRQATRDAGRIAGLEVLRIINEPTAAALAYGYDRDIDSKLAVFDLGGGTFDISIVVLAEGVFQVVATGGDSFLGGDDFDRRLIDWLAEEFERNHGVDLRVDPMSHQRLKDAAEKAKCELSLRETADINLPFIAMREGATNPSAGSNGSPLSGTTSGESLHLVRTVTREQFESLTSDLIDRCIAMCASTLAAAKITQLDEVLLVGGMTRMPRVQQAVAQFFGREPCRDIHPEEAVALGAAIQGYSLFEGPESQSLLIDVTGHSLGIMIAGGYYHKLIEQNTTIPCSRSHVFTTVRDNQTSVKILVLQGERERAEENELLGEFTLTKLRSAPKGEVEVVVTFEINADGIVKVSARDLETGRQQALTVTATSGLTEEEVRRMAQESREYLVALRREEDQERRRQEALRFINEIDHLVPVAEQALAQGVLHPSVLEGARALVSRTRVALDAGDNQAVGDLQRALEQTHRMLATALRKARLV
ncbi:MAG TPA: molecular chaperone DnaK [Polyangia bacterium]|jgi:molecular chaperone DnaK|nr:molecular chaperone DnaK [Polyangia bacterium]